MIPFFFSLDGGGQSPTGGQPKPYGGVKKFTEEAKGLQVWQNLTRAAKALQVWQSPTTRGRGQIYSVL